MPSISLPDSIQAACGASQPCARSTTPHADGRHSPAPVHDRSPPWLRLAVMGALLASAVQLLVVAQLAQHQVQRGVQLRQAQAVGMADPMGAAQHGVHDFLRTASTRQNHADARAASVHVLR